MAFLTLDPETTLFTSDTHFKHRGVLRYQPNRCFAGVDEMNQGLIDAWNSKVKPEDTVIHHGDFAFASKNHIKRFRDQLNGVIILILGNHDSYKDLKAVFDVMHLKDSMVYKVGDQLIHSCHFPMASWRDAEEGSWHLHGHYHGHHVDANLYKRMDVGVDTHPNLQPYSYAEVAEYMSTRNLTPIRHPERSVDE